MATPSCQGHNEGQQLQGADKYISYGDTLIRGNGKGHGLGVCSELPGDKPHKNHLKPDRNDHHPQTVWILSASQEGELKETSQKKSKSESRREGDIKGKMIKFKTHVSEKNGEKGHFTLCKVDHLGGLVDDDHGETHQGI
jgi:hypothetical protein